MKRGVPLVLVLFLAALIAGCGGGGTTTVIEKTVTVENGGGEGGGGQKGEESSGGEGEAAEEAAAEEEEAAEEAAAEAKEAAEAKNEAAAEKREAAAAEGKIEAPSAVVHLQTFRSPSGNIGCGMYEGGARCDIRKREWSPPARPASCPEQVDFGQGLSVGHTGAASFVCAGDTALDPSAPALGYGEASEIGGTQCISSSAGITCANHSGHGFFISTQRYKIF